MPRKKIHESDSIRAKASRDKRKAIDGIQVLRVKQFSLTLEDVFVLDELKEAWKCTGTQVIQKLLKERKDQSNHDSVGCLPSLESLERLFNKDGGRVGEKPSDHGLDYQ